MSWVCNYGLRRTILLISIFPAFYFISHFVWAWFFGGLSAKLTVWALFHTNYFYSLILVLYRSLFFLFSIPQNTFDTNTLRHTHTHNHKSVLYYAEKFEKKNMKKKFEIWIEMKMNFVLLLSGTPLWLCVCGCGLHLAVLLFLSFNYYLEEIQICIQTRLLAAHFTRSAALQFSFILVFLLA